MTFLFMAMTSVPRVFGKQQMVLRTSDRQYDTINKYGAKKSTGNRR